MENSIISTTKETIAAVWTWIVTWWIWWWLSHLHQYTKTRDFDIMIFIVSIMFWAFTWYIVSGFTDSWAITWISWAMSMKIFDIIQSKWVIILEQLVENKLKIKLNKTKWHKKQ